MKATRLPAEVDSPLDLLIFYPLADELNGVLHRAFGDSVSPNHITTAGNLLRVLIIFACMRWNSCPSAAIFLAFMAQYLSDCMDGMFARRFHCSSDFGEQYGEKQTAFGFHHVAFFVADHFTDWIFGVAVLVVLWKGFRRRQAPNALYGAAAASFVANLLFQACEHRVSSARQEEFGKPSWMCPGDRPLQNLRVLRFWGPATMNSVLAVALVVQRHCRGGKWRPGGVTDEVLKCTPCLPPPKLKR